MTEHMLRACARAVAHLHPDWLPEDDWEFEPGDSAVPAWLTMRDDDCSHDTIYWPHEDAWQCEELVTTLRLWVGWCRKWCPEDADLYAAVSARKLDEYGEEVLVVYEYLSDHPTPTAAYRMAVCRCVEGQSNDQR